ncbi:MULTISPECIES: YaaR family protein [unclassified Bacillus (in: firmicutes)]|uniref:YaaR family protein n=1 Tax=unclassified Bacillus (in: firmicutes) TaxID=185979 RepID=UPI001BEC45FB|nr:MULTISPECIES: YaaR family protein [unclassified Bacillus (in: firmicutes)]MBT2617090.1 YaaR family protein [Bacillus sp. ISL-78]MBT2632810.1 YaaR family protein [Bacillus sp. ISL-101]MBT2719141.1 YaaR family protein [Bacillus sp. ISL-57]
MKINHDIPIKLDKSRQDAKQFQTRNGRFQQMVQTQDQKMQIQTLNRLIGDIEGAGQRLVRSRTFRELAKYKALVKRFVKEAVEYGLELKQSTSWNEYGQSRPLKTVETIDAKLVELSEEILNKEKSSLEILEMIGEIKGLLINLYT